MSKQQVIVIGGGETFDTPEDYIKFLRLDMKFDPLKYSTRKSNWKENLSKDLGRRYEVIYVAMPNKLNAKYKEWEIYFDKIQPHLRNGVIFVCHSLGGIFLLKYLARNGVGCHVAATIFVSSPTDIDDRPGYADFYLQGIHPSRSHLGQIHWFHAPDDIIVTCHHSYMGQMMYGGELHLLPKRGHFIHEQHFPELLSVIRKVAGPKRSRAHEKRALSNSLSYSSKYGRPCWQQPARKYPEEFDGARMRVGKSEDIFSYSSGAPMLSPSAHVLYDAKSTLDTRSSYKR